ncbi:hypothetical protein [Actinomadura rubrisoli]|uniref:Uncharacterized protein n=1 Tax=Actinomadura rubrisoli TaxID=2530368 RepID=A0A4R5CE57_9ACTN|nr:hypothetical protein [Actinomadura rubrisoli]TDD97196.1 hypothetical protein E1298_01805 [Actinomadura rubrisoli]
MQHFPALTKGINYFPRKKISVGYNVWIVSYNGHDERRINRGEAAKIMRLVRELEAEGMENARSFFRLTYEYVQCDDVDACHRCGARPELHEMDCDGWYGTTLCGENQCPVSRKQNEARKEGGH